MNTAVPSAGSGPEAMEVRNAGVRAGCQYPVKLLGRRLRDGSLITENSQPCTRWAAATCEQPLAAKSLADSSSALPSFNWRFYKLEQSKDFSTPKHSQKPKDVAASRISRWVSIQGADDGFDASPLMTAEVLTPLSIPSPNRQGP